MKSSKVSLSPTPEQYVVLLTGASGFIGTRVQELLVKHGYQLRVLTRGTKVFPSSIDCFVGDLTDASDCLRAMDGVDIVIHAAGEIQNPDRFWSVNVQGTKNLLAAAINKRIQRFVQISTVGVIGADPLQSKIFDEDYPCMPRNDYERSKWEAEKLVCQAGSQGLEIAILRPANVFGDRDPRHGLFTLVRNVKQGRFAYLGGRDVICNYVFVEDVAHAILALTEQPKAVGRIYNLSDVCKLGEFVDVLADEVGAKRPRIGLPNRLSCGIRIVIRGVRGFTWLSTSSFFSRLVSLNNLGSFASSRLANELGYKFVVGWRAGLRRLVKWYRSQEEL